MNLLATALTSRRQVDPEHRAPDDTPSPKASNKATTGYPYLHKPESGNSLANAPDLRLSTSFTQILEILPDIAPEHLTGLVTDLISKDGRTDLVQDALHILLEDPGYPKAPRKQGKQKHEESNELEQAGPSKWARFDYENNPRRGTNYADLAVVSPIQFSTLVPIF